MLYEKTPEAKTAGPMYEVAIYINNQAQSDVQAAIES